jgi:hypothetical protein
MFYLVGNRCKKLTLLLFLLFPAAAAAQSVSPPVFSHPAGTYTESFGLNFTVPEDAVVQYTTNGDLPGPTSQTYVEGNAVNVSGTVMIRARAFREGYEPSETVTNVFIRLHPEVAGFDSNLPLVIVNQFDNVMHPEGHYRSTIYFSVIDRDSDGRARLLTDNLHLHSRSESNYRGSSSLSFPKKQFGVRLIDDEGENRNEPILGLPPENNWIMHAPYDDRTLIRNAVAYQISRDMGRYAPRTRFVELFLHEGSGPVRQVDYHGVYMLVERIKWDNNRVDIESLTPQDNAEPEITGGYIINFDRDVHIRSTHRNTGFALVRPQHDDITWQQRNWIENYLGDLERALFGNNYRDPNSGYTAYLDPGSFIDHHLITEALKEMDGYRLSTFMHKDRGGRLVMGPVWDYNLSMGNYVENHPQWGTVWNGHSPTGWYYTHVPEDAYLNGWYSRLFQDPAFQQRYRERWWELRRGAFATDHIVNMINWYVDKLGEAIDRNFERWDIIGEFIWEWGHEGFDSYEEEIDFLVYWIETRMDWIDGQMGAPPADLQASHLRYFWHFGTGTQNNIPFESLDAWFSLSNRARIRFKSALDGYPFDEDHPMWRRASLERRNNPTSLNYRPEGNEGRPYETGGTRGLQVKQPFTGDGGENTLIFDIPTTGLNNILFRFAAVDEGAADALLVDYSTQSDDSGWTTVGLATSRLPVSEEYQKYEMYFGHIPEVHDNPDFKIRIRFDGENMDADRGSRVTFNNISVDTLKMEIPTGVEYGDGDEQGVRAFRLDQNYPNPFNPATSITFKLPQRKDITLTVYNAIGQEVAVLVDGPMDAGVHSVSFDASRLASGLYLYRLRAGDYIGSRKMMLVK